MKKAVRFGLVVGLLATVTMAIPVSASPIQEGRMMFGLALGGGSGYFGIGGSAGYFVADGLRPSLGLMYQTQDSGLLTATEFSVTPGLRYYFGGLESTFFPFVDGEIGSHWLNFEVNGASQDFQFYRLGVGGGLLWMLSRNFGLEVSCGFDQYVDGDASLVEFGFLPEGLEFRYNLGFSISL